uniref:(northern house mosquito) hypothetical protein n=1 Tax=Culex pipiens TaxID=7175 RepID=A0A8D8IW51_CULPI
MLLRLTLRRRCTPYNFRLPQNQLMLLLLLLLPLLLIIGRFRSVLVRNSRIQKHLAARTKAHINLRKVQIAHKFRSRQARIDGAQFSPAFRPSLVLRELEQRSLGMFRVVGDGTVAITAASSLLAAHRGRYGYLIPV